MNIMCRKVRKYKKKKKIQMELLSWKVPLWWKKISLDGLDTRLDTAEDEISKPEEIAIEPIKN